MMQKQVIGKATLYCGDVLEVLPQLDGGSFDALITDPPYSSGGMYKSARNRDPAQKYPLATSYPEFTGDNRDQRSMAFWCNHWLSLCHHRVKLGGYVMVFTDWRQLPTISDSVQAAGFIWRGIIPWNKENVFPMGAGFFRHQCEYILWGSSGVLRGKGSHPGLITQRVIAAKKLHKTAKPVEVIAELVKPLPQDAHVLDPFMGSASTALPVLARGGSFTGIELTNEYFDIACARIEKAQINDAQV